MTKYFFKKPKKKIVSSIMLFLLLIGASYAFFTNSRVLTDESLTFGSGLNISYLLEAQTDISFDFHPAQLTQGGPNYVESSPSTSLITLGNNSGYDNVKCAYEIWYKPREVFTNSIAAGESQEMVIVGSDSSNQNPAFMFDLNGVNREEKMADGIIYVNSETTDITQTWTFTVRHYNLETQQNDNFGKTFGGTIEFKSLGCKNEQL